MILVLNKWAYEMKYKSRYKKRLNHNNFYKLIERYFDDGYHFFAGYDIYKYEKYVLERSRRVRMEFLFINAMNFRVEFYKRFWLGNAK